MRKQDIGKATYEEEELATYQVNPVDAIGPYTTIQVDELRGRELVYWMVVWPVRAQAMREQAMGKRRRTIEARYRSIEATIVAAEVTRNFEGTAERCQDPITITIVIGGDFNQGAMGNRVMMNAQTEEVQPITIAGSIAIEALRTTAALRTADIIMGANVSKPKSPRCSTRPPVATSCGDSSVRRQWHSEAARGLHTRKLRRETPPSSAERAERQQAWRRDKVAGRGPGRMQT